MRIEVGPVTEVSDVTCAAIGDERAIVVRVGDELRAYRNRCAHQGASLDGALVRRGALTCPLHSWRYRVDDGRHVDSSAKLERFPVDVVDGIAYVLLPENDDPRPPREWPLARAREDDGDAARR